MKIQTTMKDIVNRFNKVYRCGYCDLEKIMQYNEPQYYNCGVYGWNCDIYVDYKNDIAISTGYRNMRGESIPKELIEKYSVIAESIYKDWKSWEVPFEELKAKLDKNVENFFDELNKI